MSRRSGHESRSTNVRLKPEKIQGRVQTDYFEIAASCRHQLGLGSGLDSLIDSLLLAKNVKTLIKPPFGQEPSPKTQDTGSRLLLSIMPLCSGRGFSIKNGLIRCEFYIEST